MNIKALIPYVKAFNGTKVHVETKAGAASQRFLESVAEALNLRPSVVEEFGFFGKGVGTVLDVDLTNAARQRVGITLERNGVKASVNGVLADAASQDARLTNYFDIKNGEKSVLHSSQYVRFNAPVELNNSQASFGYKDGVLTCSEKLGDYMTCKSVVDFNAAAEAIPQLAKGPLRKALEEGIAEIKTAGQELAGRMRDLFKPFNELFTGKDADFSKTAEAVSELFSGARAKRTTPLSTLSKDVLVAKNIDEIERILKEKFAGQKLAERLSELEEMKNGKFRFDTHQ